MFNLWNKFSPSGPAGKLKNHHPCKKLLLFRNPFCIVTLFWKCFCFDSIIFVYHIISYVFIATATKQTQNWFFSKILWMILFPRIYPIRDKAIIIPILWTRCNHLINKISSNFFVQSILLAIFFVSIAAAYDWYVKS